MAKRLLQDLARRLDPDYPSAAASVREGLDETLTVLDLGLSERLQRSLATTTAIESLLRRTRQVKRNVKRWRDGTMVLRWVAAGVLEATKGFHRVNGCTDMPALVAALRARDVRLGLGESSEMVASSSTEPPLNFNSARDIPAIPELDLSVDGAGCRLKSGVDRAGEGRSPATSSPLVPAMLNHLSGRQVRVPDITRPRLLPR